MGLADITETSIDQAIREFDDLGRSEFLKKYGFGEARSYFLLDRGKLYDSKAIVGAAHAWEPPDYRPLGPGKFSGGEATVAGLLRRLGFSVQRSGSSGRNPTWSEEELTLALELYLREGLLDDKHPKVVELSETLNRMAGGTDVPDPGRFRNPNGVALKLANFARFDPSYPGAGMSRGGRGDLAIWERYAGVEDALAGRLTRFTRAESRAQQTPPPT